jgi:hypothetical protein
MFKLGTLSLHAALRLVVSLRKHRCARALGISAGTLQHVIRTRGEHYKQPSRELRATTLSASRARRAELRAAGLL